MATNSSLPSECSIAQTIDLYYENIESSLVASLKNIKVFKNEHFKDEKFSRKKLTPVYPFLWHSPIPLCPYANGVEEEAIEWLKKLGLLPTKQVEESVRKIEPRYITGYPLCLANYDYALIFCKCLTLWLLFDDVAVEVADDPETIIPPFDALAGNSITPIHLLNPFVVAFKEIGEEYERLGASTQFRQRLGNSMKEWVRFSVQEAIIRTSNQDRTFEEALDLRCGTIGMRPTAMLLERTIGIEIPDEISDDPLYQKCIDLAALTCCTINDLVGVGKDLIQQQMKTNIVLSHFVSMGKSLEHSYESIISIHDKAVNDFDSYTAQLLQRVDGVWYERLSWFFMALRYMQTGFAKWHQNCKRYLQYVVFEEDRILQISID